MHAFDSIANYEKSGGAGLRARRFTVAQACSLVPSHRQDAECAPYRTFQNCEQ